MWSGFALLKIVSIEDVISRVKEIAEDKLAKGMSADEFIEIGGADGFKIYATAGKTINDSLHPLHGNPRDVFMLVLDGEIEFIFENGGKATVKSAECCVLPKHLRHRCIFRRLTIAVEGVYEKGL
jgi:mannose-6-phosphate isomerase-like protein (cupin superfamily)